MREVIAIAAAAAAAATAATARVSSSNSSPPTAAVNKPGKKTGPSYPDATPDSKSSSSIAGGTGNLSRKSRRAGDVDPMLPGEVIVPSSSPLRSAMIASAAEDVAIQVACSLLAARLAWGEVWHENGGLSARRAWGRRGGGWGSCLLL